MPDLSTHRKANRALYASCENRAGERITFRIGQPADDAVINARHERLDSRLTSFAHDARGEYRRDRVTRRPIKVKHDGRVFGVRHFEIRHVDNVGRGIGSERHALAFPVPYRNVRSAL